MRSVPRKALGLARGLARNRLRYPVLRARESLFRTPVDALAELGFERERLEALDREYERAADELIPALRERAAAARAVEVVNKLDQRDLPAHESKRLVYLAVRALGAEVVYETGTFTGTLSAFVLRALEDDRCGRLHTFDLPARAPIPHAIDIPLPQGLDPGWIIPDKLRSRLTITLGDARETLSAALDGESRIDLFIHDSLHTTRHMLFEYRTAWRALRPGGLLISDDIFMTPAFWLFTRGRRVPFWHIGNVGVTRKRR